MAPVVFEHVTKQFGHTLAVDDLNLVIEDGEFLVFVGPSGCGKTTSLRLLAGLETLSSGAIYIGEQNVSTIPPKDRDIAMVFQSYALYPHMTVAENMSFALKLTGMPKAEIGHRVKTVATRLGLDPLLKRKPRELSGGQQQRVALGRAIVRDAAVFLMDEPLSNLDAKLRSQARLEITRLHQQLGKTFIYVTHDQVEAMTMGTRIAIMQNGVLQQIDTPEAIYRRPHNLFVAEFMGSPAMNFFKVTLTQNEDNLWARSESLFVLLPDWIKQSLERQPRIPHSCILGIRPEDIYDPDMVSSIIDPASLKARVTNRELLGYEVILYLNNLNTEGIEGQAFIARVNARTEIKPGDRVEMHLDRQRLHLFDAATQLSLL